MKNERAILIALKISGFCVILEDASKKKLCGPNRPSTEKSRQVETTVRKLFHESMTTPLPAMAGVGAYRNG